MSRGSKNLPTSTWARNQAKKKGGRKGHGGWYHYYPHLPGGEERIEELANSLPHPPAASCLPEGGGFFGSCCPLRPAPSLSPRDSVELERSGSREPGLDEAGTIRSSGRVGLVWPKAAERERGRRDWQWCGVCLLAWLVGWVGWSCLPRDSHTKRQRTRLEYSLCFGFLFHGFGFLRTS